MCATRKQILVMRRDSARYFLYLTLPTHAKQ